jgi:hypothetical protein
MRTWQFDASRARRCVHTIRRAELGALPLSLWRTPFVPCMIRDIGDRGEPSTEVWT